MIQINNLSVRFRRFMAVDQLSLEVPSGQVFGFLGPNGAGKSTTVKVLTGVLHPTSGDVQISGHSIPSKLDQVKALCGYVPDTEDLFEELSGRDNLKIFSSLYRLPISRVDDVLAKLELSEAANLAVARYSKGMRKKLLLAREILHQPKVLICDEPTANLDSHSTRLVRRLLLDLRDQGTTIFLTTHNMTEVEEICDRVAIISRGRLVDLDTPIAFMTRHAERKVQVEREVDGQQVRQLYDLEEVSSRTELATLITDHSELRIHSLDFRFDDVFRKLTGDAYK
ncbi:MAG: ABC transporter ATP-binding protein [Planctomycetota bacterium]